MQTISIAIHGGAGTIQRSLITAAQEQQYRLGLETAMEAGYAVLEKGGNATDAVLAAVVSLEDNILFNAGRGSVFTNTGKHEMDASVMEGKTGMAGAITAVTNVRNPVLLAAEVMRHSEHVFMCGEGAMAFARERALTMEPDEYFFSQFRYEQLLAVQQAGGGYALDHSGAQALQEKKFGTVGAVACDAGGNLASATSTGGMTNKKYGRIGDSPVIGAGTYAQNDTCAISCTGHGEVFIKAVAAYDVSCLMAYKGLTLQQAMEQVTLDKLVHMQGEGGMIGVDASGNTCMVFNSEGMYRATCNNKGYREISIYR